MQIIYKEICGKSFKTSLALSQLQESYHKANRNGSRPSKIWSSFKSTLVSTFMKLVYETKPILNVLMMVKLIIYILNQKLPVIIIYYGSYLMGPVLMMELASLMHVSLVYVLHISLILAELININL